MTTENHESFWKALGPGILFASAAIGTSHLVQSTRAGAMFGLGLLAVVILANVLKYPAFRFGPQYTAATGRSLIEGYRDLGRWIVGLFVVVEIAVMTIVVAATAIVTAAILMAVTGMVADARHIGVALIIVAVVMLGIGGYRLLDRLAKVFVLILTVATLTATAFSLPRIDWDFSQVVFSVPDIQTFGFIIALMGFMPSGLDNSVLQSLWSIAKQRATGTKLSMAHVLTDFHVGYLVSAGLAICFLLMGAGVMHSTGQVPATGAAPFAEQIIELFTANLGKWAGSLVGVSALFVMFSTLIAVVDGFPRLLATAILTLKSDDVEKIHGVDKSPLLHAVKAFLVGSASFTLLYLMHSFQAFIDFVTITAFVVGPVIAILNHLVITSDDVPPEHRPIRFIQLWSLLGILVMSVLAILYLYVRFGST